MTPDELRAVDARVAKEVMGWTEVKMKQPDGGVIYPMPPMGFDAANNRYASLPRYTTSIADAWLVVEKAKTDGWPVDVGVAFDWDGDPVGYYANFTSEHTARHKDVEVAICKAGLSFFAALKVREEG